MMFAAMGFFDAGKGAQVLSEGFAQASLDTVCPTGTTGSSRRSKGMDT